jgi:hypothetical protein
MTISINQKYQTSGENTVFFRTYNNLQIDSLNFQEKILHASQYLAKDQGKDWANECVQFLQLYPCIGYSSYEINKMIDLILWVFFKKIENWDPQEKNNIIHTHYNIIFSLINLVDVIHIHPSMAIRISYLYREFNILSDFNFQILVQKILSYHNYTKAEIWTVFQVFCADLNQCYWALNCFIGNIMIDYDPMDKSLACGLLRRLATQELFEDNFHQFYLYFLEKIPVYLETISFIQIVGVLDSFSQFFQYHPEEISAINNNNAFLSVYDRFRSFKWMSSEQLFTIIVSYDSLKILLNASDILDALAEHVRKRMSFFNCEQLTIILNIFLKNHLQNNLFFTLFIEKLEKKIDDFSSREIFDVLCNFAKKSYDDSFIKNEISKTIYEKYADKLLKDTDQFEPHELKILRSAFHVLELNKNSLDDLDRIITLRNQS